jgi:hypothetical protein
MMMQKRKAFGRICALDLKEHFIIASFPIFVFAARFIPFGRLPSVCAFYLFTRLPCPSCGMTRAFVALMHFDVQRAVRMNLLSIPLFAGFVVWWAVSTYQIVSGRKTRLGEWAAHRASRLTFLGIVILFLFGALRILLPGMR